MKFLARCRCAAKTERTEHEPLGGGQYHRRRRAIIAAGGFDLLQFFDSVRREAGIETPVDVNKSRLSGMPVGLW